MTRRGNPMPRGLKTVKRFPTRQGEVWVHIDRFDKKSKAVFAVQRLATDGSGRRIYQLARKVKASGHAEYRCFGQGQRAQQPKAVAIYRDAMVVRHGDTLIVMNGASRLYHEILSYGDRKCR